MRMRPLLAAMATLLVWGFVSPAAAQKVKAPKPPKPPPAPHVNPNNGNRGGGGNKPDPVKELEQFQKMSPEQREKQLSKLPAQRRARVEEQMKRLDEMTPEQRERAFYRLETMQHLTPERRQAVNDEIQYVKNLPAGQARRDRLFSDEFRKQYTPEEQKVIRDTFPVGRQGPDAKN
jgi:hypothetical protein